MDRNAVLTATAIGLIAQVAMVVAGHYIPFIKEKGFAIGGMAISLAAGLIYARLAAGTWGGALLGGAVSGGVCAFIGIVLCVALKDAPTMVLALGTASSTVTGLIGGAIGRWFG